MGPISYNRAVEGEENARKLPDFRPRPRHRGRACYSSAFAKQFPPGDECCSGQRGIIKRIGFLKFLELIFVRLVLILPSAA